MMMALPLETASWLMGAIWRAVAPHTHRHARALRHLQIAFPEKSDAQRNQIALAMWDNMGRTAAESLCIDKLLNDPSRFDDRTGDVCMRVRDNGKGAVLISLHMGNWEVAAMPGLIYDLQPMGVYQRIRNPLVDAYVRARRHKLYPAGLIAKSREATRTLYEHAVAGGHICMLADHRQADGIEVQFFGQPAMSLPYPAAVALRLDIPLIVGRTVRLDGVRFALEAEEIPLVRTGDRKRDTVAVTQAVQAVFERWVRDNPGQWMWTHQRWRVRGNPEPHIQDHEQAAAPLMKQETAK